MPNTLHWQKSSFSGADAGDTCVELAPTTSSIRIRESDHPTAVLTTTPTPLHALLTTLKAGTLDGR